MSAFGGKADVRELPAVCPLIARSGHQGGRGSDDKLDGTGNPGDGLPVQFHPVAISINELTADRNDYGSICLKSCLKGPFASAIA